MLAINEICSKTLFHRHSILVFHVNLVFIVAMACKKPTDAYKSECTDTGLRYSGNYIGTFNHIEGCYTCIPFIDTIYAGNVRVKLVGTDSFQIENFILSCNEPFLYESNSWYRDKEKDIYYYTDLSLHGAHYTIEFKSPDILNYELNNDGSAGYTHLSFKGIKQ